jgi:hypothetical protein
MSTGIRQIIALSTCIIVLFPYNAQAYLDPGTGSYIIQMVIAGLLGAAFAMKIFWARIKNFFNRVFSKGQKHG